MEGLIVFGLSFPALTNNDSAKTFHFFTQLPLQNQISILRITGIAEGVSFLVLLLIAMPLKYYADLPLAVKIVGWAHGILFMAYTSLVFLSIRAMRWNWIATITALAASLIPCGTFILDKSWKKREQDLKDEKRQRS